MESINPFRYGEPLPVEELLDRDREAEALLQRAVEGNNTRLVAPRRYGKTERWLAAPHDDGPWEIG